jgi:hypothetical protein
MGEGARSFCRSTGLKQPAIATRGFGRVNRKIPLPKETASGSQYRSASSLDVLIADRTGFVFQTHYTDFDKALGSTASRRIGATARRNQV